MVTGKQSSSRFHRRARTARKNPSRVVEQIARKTKRTELLIEKSAVAGDFFCKQGDPLLRWRIAWTCYRERSTDSTRADETSDIDFPVEMRPGSLHLIVIKNVVSYELGLHADVFTEQSLSRQLKEQVLREAIPF